MVFQLLKVYKKKDVLFSSWQSETKEPFLRPAETAAEQIYDFILAGTSTVAQAQLDLATQIRLPALPLL